MLAVHNSVYSKISGQSKKQSSISKMSPSTHNTQSPQGSSSKNKNNFTSCENSWDSSSTSKRASELHKQIEEMEKQQLQMQTKFQQCIQSMLSQVQRNNENNARLATEAKCLKHQLTQSKKDILLLEEYIKANLKKEVKNRVINDSSKLDPPITSRRQLASSSSSKNILQRRTPSKLFNSKLLLKH